MAGIRRFKVDFFCVTRNGERQHNAVRELLQSIPSSGCSAAVALEGGKEQHQLRGIVSMGGGNVYRAVFGRCRYGEELTQGDETGAEAEVLLKPGHGLVEKNHLLFVPARNLVVYQRNSNGSHHKKLQAYLNKVCDGRFVLEPILQRDAYQKLIQGGELKRVEMSFAAPADPSVYGDILTARAAALVRECGAVQGQLRMSVGRTGKRMGAWVKDAVNSMARSGLATVARVKLEDLEDPVDLIADRLVKSAAVEVGSDGKVASHAYFSALESARSEAREPLRVFFGS